MIVVADTSPVNYLLLIGRVRVLESLFGQVVLPSAVRAEMLAPSAPHVVRGWANQLPAWVEVRDPETFSMSLHPRLGAGEREAITLAQAGGRGSLLLIDEDLGRREAARLGLTFTGTLGILQQAHERGLLDILAAIEGLRATNFKASEELYKRFTDLA